MRYRSLLCYNDAAWSELARAELLRLLDLFLPRINFGKPVGDVREGAAGDPTGFSYLKRDLVRLLGILVHRNKEVQDRVRVCGGIPVVMNLCVVDERNPCTFPITEFNLIVFS